MKKSISPISSIAWVFGGFATAATLVWLSRSGRSRRREYAPMRGSTAPHALEGSWSPVWVAETPPAAGAGLPAMSESEELSSQADLLEVDPEIYEEMNPTPSARYESLYLMDHLVSEESDEPMDSDNLGSDWLLRATQSNAPAARGTKAAFDATQMVIDLGASTLDEAEIVRSRARQRRRHAR